MPPQAPPLDEQEWEGPHIIRELPGAALTTDNLYWYFSWSPYYESTCMNTALWTQIQKLPDGISVMLNRQRFEELLERDYPVGLRYMITAEPQAPGQPWVIQRQNRSRNPETDDIETAVEGTYYVQGIKILQAPSLLSVLQSRLLQVSQHMSEFFEQGKQLSHWSPATGHTYLPPSYDPPKATTASRIGSPILAPEADGSQPTETSTTEFSDDLFLSSLHLANRYGHEFMDENPLKGEPGAFVFSNTLGHVDARNRAQAAAQNQPPVSVAAASALPMVKVKGETESAANSVAATPAQSGLNRKSSVPSLPTKEKKERRKSKGLNSPSTPTVP